MAEENKKNENNNQNETENKKISMKERFQGFKEKHPKIVKCGVYLGCAGAGALVAIGGKPILDALGFSGKSGFPEGEPTEQEETERKEEKE